MVDLYPRRQYSAAGVPMTDPLRFDQSFNSQKDFKDPMEDTFTRAPPGHASTQYMGDRPAYSPGLQASTTMGGGGGQFGGDRGNMEDRGNRRYEMHDISPIKRGDTLGAIKEDEENKPAMYLGDHVFKFLKELYLKQRGVPFSVGMMTGGVVNEGAGEKAKRDPVSLKADSLVEFWKQRKQLKGQLNKKQGGRGIDGSLNESRLSGRSKSRPATALPESGESTEEKILSSREKDIRFTLEKDIQEEYENQAASHLKRNVKVQLEEKKNKLKNEMKAITKGVEYTYKTQPLKKNERKFMETCLVKFREQHGTCAKDSQGLFDWWLRIENKKKEGVAKPLPEGQPPPEAGAEEEDDATKDNQEVKLLFDQYFTQQAKLDRVKNMYKMTTGFEAAKKEPLVQFWKNIKDKDQMVMAFKNTAEVNELYDQRAEEQKKEKEEQETKEKAKQERTEKKKKEKLKEKVGIKGEPKSKGIEDLAKPKDKWAVGRSLMAFQKQFPLDKTLNKMVKEEFKQNKLLRYPEEYEVYDEEDEKKRRLARYYIKKDYEKIQDPNERRDFIKEKEENRVEKRKLKKEEWVRADNIQKNSEILDKEKFKSEDEQIRNHVVEEVKTYNKLRGKRLEEDTGTLKNYIGKVYWNMVDLFPEPMRRKFPYVLYGNIKEEKKQAEEKNKNAHDKRFGESTIIVEEDKKINEGDKKSKIADPYPVEFKNYFIKILRSFVQTNAGMVQVKENVTPCWMPASVQGKSDIRASIKQIVNKSTNLKAKKEGKELLSKAVREKAWIRPDTTNHRQKILMTYDEIENCTFEPKCGKLSDLRHQKLAKKYELKVREEEGAPGESEENKWVKKLGVNFKGKHPEVFKSGVLRRAIKFHNEGRLTSSLKKLSEGFNIKSVLGKYYPKEYKRLLAKEQREAKRKKAAEDNNEAYLVREICDMGDNRLGEDYENKLLLPILEDAATLAATILDQQNRAEKTIQKLETPKKKEAKSKEVRDSKAFSASIFDRDSVKKEEKKEKVPGLSLSMRVDTTEYKSIMCPLKEKCGEDVRPRWPTTNTKSIRKFGVSCPFAHHYNELKFKQETKTLDEGRKKNIQQLNKFLEEDVGMRRWVPASSLANCYGCGKCNKCKINILLTKKQKDFVKKSAAKNEQMLKSETRQQKAKELKEKDDQFNYKFGLLKKSTVLFGSERYFDASEVINKCKILVDKEQIRTEEKQRLKEKKWKFRLGIAADLQLDNDELLFMGLTEKTIDTLGLPITEPQLINYVEKTKIKEGDKNEYLNLQIKIFHEKVNRLIAGKEKTIQRIKKMKDKLEEGDEISTPEKNKKKREMCEYIKKGEKCPEGKKCRKAHFAIELDLVPLQRNIKNLENTIQKSKEKLKKSRPVDAWKPARSGFYEPSAHLDVAQINYAKKQHKQALRSKSMVNLDREQTNLK